MKQCIHHGNKQDIYNYCYCNKHNSYALLRENQDHLCEGCENRDAALLLLRRWTQMKSRILWQRGVAVTLARSTLPHCSTRWGAGYISLSLAKKKKKKKEEL